MTYMSSDLLQDYLDGRLDDDRAEIVEQALRENPDVSVELERLRENVRFLRGRELDTDLPEEWQAMIGESQSRTGDPRFPKVCRTELTAKRRSSQSAKKGHGTG